MLFVLQKRCCTKWKQAKQILVLAA